MPLLALGKILQKEYGYSPKKALDLMKVHNGLIDCCNKKNIKDEFIALGIHERETGERKVLV